METKNAFPRTVIGGLSISRMIMGTNNIMGGSHRTFARDTHIKQINNNSQAVADIIQAYLAHGVDTVVGGLAHNPFFLDGVKMAGSQTQNRIHMIELANVDTNDSADSRGSAAQYIKNCKNAGIDICLLHHYCIEQLVNKQKGKIERIEDYLYMIRENGMIPGFSAHMPEIVQYADNRGYDVETYIQIYNASGFLMQMEVETVHKIIWGAKKPVLTIKPMAAGHLNPFVGLTFVWNTIRDQDMVAVGCMTPGEVHECVEFSMAAIEHRKPDVEGRCHQYHK
ncbi:MAG: hypothetical protein FWD23_06925 [Oscillospiraceae bacterium]|nr:hypothetical protein [Oscillospiraceae bacterium]